MRTERLVARTITTAQRFGVWDAWAGRCFWCREPTLFRNCHVDHLLPLSALEIIGAQELITRYKLPEDFGFDDFENWVPSCQSCNLRKQSTLVDPSPNLNLHLMQVRMKARVARRVSEAVAKDRKKASLLAKLATAIEAGDIEENDIRELLSGLPVMVRRAAALPDEYLFIAPGWEVVRSGGTGRIVRVSQVLVAGTAPTSTTLSLPRR